MDIALARSFIFLKIQELAFLYVYVYVYALCPMSYFLCPESIIENNLFSGLLFIGNYLPVTGLCHTART